MKPTDLVYVALVLIAFALARVAFNLDRKAHERMPPRGRS